METTSHNQSNKVPAQDTVDGVHNSPAAETPFATKPTVKRAAGTHQPSASLAHSQGEVGPVGFSGGAHCFSPLSASALQAQSNAPTTTSHPSGKGYPTGGTEREQNRMDCAKN